MVKFKYDVFTLIELVESKPCLWDKTLELYRNKIARKNAWKEICIFFEPDFENMDDKNKKEIIDGVIAKWTSVRDSFMKSLKTKSGDGQKKKYIYHKHLQFILKVLTPEETVSNIHDYQDSVSDTSHHASAPNALISQPEYVSGDLSPESSTSGNKRLQPNSKKRMNPIDVEILKAIQSTDIKSNASLEPDEDQAFLLSTLSTVKKIADDDKLEFQIEYMQLLRKYTNKMRWRHLSHNSFATTEGGNRSSEINLCYGSDQNIGTPLQNIHLHESESSGGIEATDIANESDIFNMNIAVPSNIQLQETENIRGIQATDIANENDIFNVNIAVPSNIQLHESDTEEIQPIRIIDENGIFSMVRNSEP